MDIHWQSLEHLSLEGQAEHAFLRTDVDAVVAGQQGRHILVDAELGDA